MIERADPERLRSLTARERDCLRLILENRTSKEVGRMLGISHTSVDTHVRRARAKLGLRDRYAAARLLAQWELTDSAAAVASPAPTGVLGLPPIEHLPAGRRLMLVVACALVLAVVFAMGLMALMGLAAI